MKIIALSDLHGHYEVKVPDGDVVVFAGDITPYGSRKDLHAFRDWVKTLPHKHKIAVAGNHDFCFERNYYEALEILDGEVIYLENDFYKIDDVVFFGSPYTHQFQNWAFMGDEDFLYEKFKFIDERVDVLITHSPPEGIMDKSSFGPHHIGSSALRYFVDEYKDTLKAHIFGHCHDGHGSSGIFHNVAVLNEAYQLAYEPTIIEI